MIMGKGFTLVGLSENLRRVLPIIDAAFEQHGGEVFITAAKWGRDHFREAHESGRALDVQLPFVCYDKTLALLTAALGLNYTIRRMINHLHIEYTPMGLNPEHPRLKGVHHARMFSLWPAD